MLGIVGATAAGCTTTTPATRAAPSASGGGRSPGGTAVATCTARQLHVGVDRRHVPGIGTTDRAGRTVHALLVDFENSSSTACSLYGYPSAVVVDIDGRKVGWSRPRLHGGVEGLKGLNGLGGVPSGQTQPPTVLLRPGEVASALFEGTDQTVYGSLQAGCGEATFPELLVTPPNTTTPVRLGAGWPKCISLTVYPVRRSPNPPAR